MNLVKALSLVISVVLLHSCSTSKKSTFWVSGLKSECSAGAGLKDCLNTYSGEDLNEAKWQSFYESIEGFEFEEGIVKRIEVKEEKLNAKKLPADKSSVKYTLIKVLDEQPDMRLQLQGDWILSKLNEEVINRSIILPTLKIAVDAMQVSGSGGCNNYSGGITNVGTRLIQIGNIISTKKACFNRNIEDEYFKALNQIKSYDKDGDNLFFYDDTGNKLLSFIKEKKLPPMKGLHDIWIVTRIDGVPLNNSDVNPRMEINLTEQKVYGNDGCNEYSGAINEVSDKEISFGQMASTKKMCPHLSIANNFYNAVDRTVEYSREGLNLTFLDKGGNEVLFFSKGD